jgi:hypothetical protein
MSDAEKTGKLWGLGIASALLCLAAFAEAAAGPSPLPALKPVAVDVDTSGLPSSEQAALLPLIRAARHLLEAGAIAASADGRFTINRAAADADIARAATEFISPMSRGDATAVKSLLQHYVMIAPAIRDMLARLGPAPPQQRLVYSTADRLSPPAR